MARYDHPRCSPNLDDMVPASEVGDDQDAGEVMGRGLIIYRQ